MTPESYEKLKNLYPSNCLDSNTNKKYPWAFPKFIPDLNDLFSNNIFVDIFIIINSSEKRIKKFHSKKTKLMYRVQSSRMSIVKEGKKPCWIRIPW